MRKAIGKIRSNKLLSKYRRRLHLRSKLSGSALVPRVCFTKSNRNVYIQVIDDDSQNTLFSVQSFGKNSAVDKLGKDSVKALADEFVSKSKKANLSNFVFDRSGNKYTGLIKIFAESLRESGLKL
jgi:large subunit ribosomal protein L18